MIHRYEDEFLALCREENFQPNIRALNKQLTINVKWAEAGLGVAIVPEDCLSYSNKPLAFKTFRDPRLTTRRAIVTMKNGFHSKAVQNFLALCRENL